MPKKKRITKGYQNSEETLNKKTHPKVIQMIRVLTSSSYFLSFFFFFFFFFFTKTTSTTAGPDA